MKHPYSWPKCATRCMFIISCCVSLLTNAFSQTSNYVPKINIPTSPEAAVLGRFGDIPIGYYTGTADISVPLYTVKEGHLEIPITLRYHSSGIKVDDQATWAGLGWDLSPEGSIIQEVRGADDDNESATCSFADFPAFFQRFQFLQDTSYLFLQQWGRSTATDVIDGDPACQFPRPAPWNNGYQDPYCVIDQLLRGISQPDIYTYTFNGYSGKFYIHPTTHEVVVIEKNDHVYFQKVNFNKITATTLDGTIYTFDAVETAHGGTFNEYTGKTYKLTEIKLLTGKMVTFTYTDNRYTEQLFSQKADLIWFAGLAVSENTSYTYHNKKTLVQITSSDAIVNFNLSARDDINVDGTDDLKKLSSIDILSRQSGNKIKTIEFTYSYFPYNSTGVVYNSYISAHTDAFGKRLKLDAVKETGYNNAGQPVITKPPYQFEYDMTVTMPMKVSFARDFWGFYNGAFNTTQLPNLDYFDYLNDPQYSASSNLNLNYPYTGADRYTDNTKAGAYLLTKIIYPTGGSTGFEYEPNSFTNQFIPDKSKNIFKSYQVQDNSLGGTNTQTFGLSRETTIHFENRIYNGAGNPNGIPPLTYQQMQGCYISLSKLKTVNGTLTITPVHQWGLDTILATDFDANNGKTWRGDLRVAYDPDPTVSYQIKVVFPDNLNNPGYLTIAGVTSNLNFYDNTGFDASQSVQCGMRIRSIKNYSETGVLANHKQIKYYDGKLLNRFVPLTAYPANNLNVRDFTNGNGLEYIALYRKITVPGSGFGTGGGNLIGYGKVEEIALSNGTAANGKNVFYYKNRENKTMQDCPNIPRRSNGLIEKEEVYDNLGNKLREKLYDYTKLLPFPAKYIGINVVTLSTGSLVPVCNLTYPTPYTTQYYDNNGAPYVTSQYGYNAYTIDAEYLKPGTITTKEFAEGIVYTKTEVLTYNAEGNVKTATTTSSKGETLVSNFYYPNDYMVDATVDNYMTSKHNTGTPVITEQYKGTTLLSRQKIVWGLFSNVGTMLPQYTYTKKGNSSEEKRMTVDSYDDKGNITQYTQQDNIPVAIVWNADKTLPIAKVENATYASLLALPNGLNSDFRAGLPNARVTSFTYKPLIGVATITDVNNKTSYYEYDAYGRLQLVRDQDGNIIKTYDYHFKQ